MDRVNAPQKRLLASIVCLDHGNFPQRYRALGYETAIAWDTRKAVSLVRTFKPDVIVADFHFQSDFRDRLSNLESVLAAAQKLAGTRVVALYDSRDEEALERVRQRSRIDAALAMPVDIAALETLLNQWLES